MSNTDFSNLDPLPSSDRNRQLEKLSINAFNSALPVDKFTFRDERINDVGVDGSLELEINGKFTNLRSQVQLKATDSKEELQDGSVSIPITTANLNYLLSGPSPLYVLYVSPTNELRYLWARDERQRIEKINLNWMQQDKVKIRFKKILNNEAIDEIHEHIQIEAQMQRQINDILSSASNLEHPTISINPETLEITNSERAKEILLTSGKLFVTSGYPEKVRNLSKLLDDESEKSPRILIIKAYAEQMLGKFQNAHIFLSEAKLNRDSLGKDDKQFLDLLAKSCEYETGRITLEEFSSFLSSYKADLSGHIAQSVHINQLRYSILTTADQYQKPEVVNALTSLVEKILSDSSTSDVFKLYAKSIWIEVEGLEIATGTFRDLAANDVRVSHGLKSQISEVAKEYNLRLKKWLSVRSTAIEEAKGLNHKSLLASLNLSSALVSFHQLTSNYSLALLLNKPIELLFDDIYKDDIELSVNTSLELIDESIRLFQQTNNIEGEIRAKMLIADFYEFTGRILEAKKLAESVLPIAEAYGYVRQVEHAQEHIAGNGLKSKLSSSKKESTPKEKETKNANWTDKEILFLATQMISIFGIPDDRYSIMEKEYFSIRDIAKEKLNWCRHIELWQDKKHFQSQQTLFSKNPDRLCVCTLHNYESIIHNPDWKSIIPAFKKTYCENCPDRNALENEN